MVRGMKREKSLSKKIFFICLFISIIALAVLLRLNALSPFKIYPDSYQSLLVAQNITTYQSVVGYLGPKGMLYPDFVSWTRPGYPLLIVLGTFFSSDMTYVAQTISFTFGLLAIPLVFLLTKTIFRSYLVGLCGAFLTAISFYNTVWSGFIMTETSGVFFLLLFLLSFLRKQESMDPRPRGDDKGKMDIVSGILFAFAVLTRYEYLILLFPLIIFLFLTKANPLKHLITIGVSFIAVLIVIGLQFFPLESLDKIIIKQLKDFWPFVLLGVTLLPLIIFFVKRNLTRTIAVMFIGIGIIIMISFIGESFLALRAFILHEIFLVVCFFIGIALLRKKQTALLFFILLSITVLGIVYYRVNPTMDRYFTHLLPLLLIPASFGLKEIFLTQKLKKWGILLKTVLILLILGQVLLTYQGLRYLHDDSWFHTSYEEKSATIIKNKLKNNKYVLITSQPEPYFYITQFSTQSLTDYYPFVFISSLPKNQPLIIVEDMGMHAYFPQFTTFLKRDMINNKIAKYFVGENYHRESLSNKEISPVILYETTVEELQTKIRQNQDD